MGHRMQRVTGTAGHAGSPPSDPTDADVVATLAAIRTRITPPVGAAMLYNLIYAVGFTRISGSVEGAEAVDRAGTGKIHRHGDRRADDTTHHFLSWMRHGAHSAESRASIATVMRMHDHYGQLYAMSNETFVHGIAVFTLLFDEVLQIVGVDAFSDEEKAAQVAHWFAIGEQLGVQNMPDSWSGMQHAMLAYEADPQWFRPTPEGYRCTRALIDQFNNRWLPRFLHPVGRAVLLSLQPDQVLWAAGERKPPAIVVQIVRLSLRGLITAQTHLTGIARRFR